MHKVYLITLKNNSQYVGYTSRSIDERAREHIKYSKKGKTKFARFLRKYGFEKTELLAEYPDEFSALKHEIIYIDEHSGLLNSSAGGEGSSLLVSMHKVNGERVFSVEKRDRTQRNTSPKKYIPRRRRRRRR